MHDHGGRSHTTLHVCFAPKATVKAGLVSSGMNAGVEVASGTVIQAPKLGPSNHALRTHRLRIGGYQAVPTEQAA